ncbi:MAG: hypothetical protein LUG61_06735 [Lachnospiraceae bacterium]|nr:hypothetical protein [Lachnospiraceae bacterium]
MEREQARKGTEIIKENETEQKTTEDPGEKHKKGSFPHVLFFVAVFIWDEILLRIFTETVLFSHLLFPLLSAITLGLFCGAVTSLFSEKINYVLTVLILTVVSVFFAVECVVRRTYQTYMTLSSMLAGSGNVLGEFRSDLITAVVHSFHVILLYLLPVILYLIFGKRHLPVQRKKPVYCLRLAAAAVVVGLLTVAGESSFSSVSQLFREQYEYDTTTQAFGLISGTLLDFSYSLSGKKTVSFVSAEEKKDVAETENVERESAAVESVQTDGKKNDDAADGEQKAGSAEIDETGS